MTVASARYDLVGALILLHELSDRLNGPRLNVRSPFAVPDDFHDNAATGHHTWRNVARLAPKAGCDWAKQETSPSRRSYSSQAQIVVR